MSAWLMVATKHRGAETKVRSLVCLVPARSAAWGKLDLKAAR